MRRIRAPPCGSQRPLALHANAQRIVAQLDLPFRGFVQVLQRQVNPVGRRSRTTVTPFTLPTVLTSTIPKRAYGQ